MNSEKPVIDGDYDLYNGTPPYVEQDTSLISAEEIKPHVNKLQFDIWHFIRYMQVHGKGGATCCEVEEYYRMKHQTISPRIRELKIKGLVKDSGHRRKTESGRPAIVWCLANTPPEHMGVHESLRDKAARLANTVVALKKQLDEADEVIAKLLNKVKRLEKKISRNAEKSLF